MKQQRQLDWSRQDEMVRYLVQIKNHKFAPVLVVQTRDWVYRDNADEWGENKKAQKSTINFEPLDYKGNIGLIDIGDGTYSYALDGQHRLMAIKGLIDFINTGKLLIYDKEKNKKNEMTAEDLKIPLENLQKLKYERIGIEFITAVCKGEKKEDAFIKVRSIFTHVNKYAKKLTKSEQAQLDEDNGFAIVARKSVKDSPLLNTEGKNPRVEIAYAVLKDDAEEFTTLHTLQEMAKLYLTSSNELYEKWQPSISGLAPIRPEEDEIKDGENIFLEYLEYFFELPSVKKINQGEKVKKCRKENNLLFRAVGQTILDRKSTRLNSSHL